MLLEMHCHTLRHSPCSDVDPVTLVRLAMKRGLGGIVLTEHHYLWQEDQLRWLKKKSRAGKDFLILSGQEVGTDKGHVLVYGADKTIDEIFTMEELREGFPRAALVWAHPFRWHGCPTDEELTSPLFDGIEVLNSNQSPGENSLSLDSWKRLSFNAIGGSDTHSKDQAATFPTRFEKAIETMEDLVREIKARRCKPAERNLYTLS
ncbi:MAG: PHP domain-containing protein [Deltaproteobacteria bacterium]|nr:PHP domain-containing protein [Deltaproteobacteria bacterium]